MTKSKMARCSLLIASLLLLVWPPISSAQQNGEDIILASRPRAASSSSSANSKTNEPRVLQYLDANGQPVLVQFTYVGPPKILPIASADSYPEGSTINLICTVSGGQRKGLNLGWFREGQELSDEALRYTEELANLSIEKTGADITILRITNATNVNSGRYGCKATNPLGEDSTSVNILINGRLAG